MWRGEGRFGHAGLVIQYLWLVTEVGILRLAAMMTHPHRPHVLPSSFFLLLNPAKVSLFISANALDLIKGRLSVPCRAVPCRAVPCPVRFPRRKWIGERRGGGGGGRGRTSQPHVAWRRHSEFRSLSPYSWTLMQN